MVTRRQVLTTAAGVAAVSALQIRPAYADYTMSVNPQSNWGTWEGWGTSLCWWANVYGTQDLLADILFTRNAVTYNGQSLPGLGMNIARYNAGGCTTVPINGDSMVVSPRIPSWKQIQGFWLNWLSADPASSSWNWTVDAPQRAMLAKARDRGANLLELFSNSPLWWMCINHNPSGAANGGDNLQSWNYQQHAVYLATVAKYAHDHWGIDFDSVDAFNEPAADWWRADGTQEGCHVSPSIQAQVIGHLRSELDNRGLTETAVSASDESLYDQARSTWASFSSATRAKVGRVNVHGYQYEGGRRDLLFNEVSAAGKPLWQSEYGDGDGTGMKMARNLTYDLRWLHPTAWVYWQAFDGLEWGLIYCDENAGTLGAGQPEVLRVRAVLPAHPAGHADPRPGRRQHRRGVRRHRASVGAGDGELRHRPVDQLRPLALRVRRRRWRRCCAAVGDDDRRRRGAVRGAPHGHGARREAVLVLGSPRTRCRRSRSTACRSRRRRKIGDERCPAGGLASGP